MTYVLCFDAGTTSGRALMVDKKGEIVAIEQKPITQHYPKHGWVEHDPEELWEIQLEVASRLLEKSAISPHDVAAIGITNQRETTLIWDKKSGKAVYHAIVWSDRRKIDLIDEIREKHEDLIREKTGLRTEPYFSAPKIAWILENVPGVRERAEKGELLFGTVNTWLVWKLTKGEVFVTDVTNASRTLLFNIHTLEWDKELLSLFKIPETMLPEVASNSEVYGKTHTDHFVTRIPIAGMAGDQHAALFGQACFDIGDVKCTFGTGSFMLMNTGGKPVSSKYHLLTTIAWKLGSKETEYSLEGTVYNAGSVVNWLRDNLGIIRTAKEIEALAFAVPDSGGVVFVPSFNGLAAPYWKANARGALFGITASTNIAHIARATLEGVAHQVTDVLEVMQKDSGAAIKQIKCGGGMSEDIFLLQIQADLLGIDIARSASKEATGLGAAFMAGLAVKVWEDQDEIKTLWKSDRKFAPELEEKDVSKMRDHWQKAVKLTSSWSDV